MKVPSGYAEIWREPFAFGAIDHDSYYAKTLVRIGDQLFKFTAMNDKWKQPTSHRRADVCYRSLMKANTFVYKWNRIQDAK